MSTPYGTQATGPTYPSTSTVSPGSTVGTTSPYGSSAQSSTQTGTQFGGVSSNQPAAGGGVASTINDAQVTTVVQQLDTEGPGIVDRITTQVGTLACSPDTVTNLVNALHTGTPVAISTDVNGQKQSATFNPSGTRLGYGEAYLALALAAQELRNSGITGCATPQQWQSVLLGGPTPTTATGTSVSSTSTGQFPGIITLRNQGQGWGQIAQSANVELGPLVSGVTSTNQTASARSQTSSSSPSPTGYSSREMNRGRGATTSPSTATSSSTRSVGTGTRSSSQPDK